MGSSLGNSVCKAMIGRSLLQILSFRALTFVLNIVLLRILPLKSLGTVTLTYALGRSFTYFLLTDAVRRVVATSSRASLPSRQQLLYLPALIALLLLLPLQLFFLPSPTATLYTCSIFLETLGEFPLTVSLISLDQLPRSLAESVASTSKTLSLISMLYLPKHLPLGLGPLLEDDGVKFGISACLYSLSFTITLWATYTPPPAARAPILAPNMLQVAAPLVHLTFSSLLQNLLTELDKVTLNLLHIDPAAGGVYALTSSYGGIVIRLLLSPITDLCKSNFAISKDTKTLRLVLKLSLYIAAVIVTFGPSYIPTLLLLLRGQTASDPLLVSSLQYYCYYIFALAMNGCLETYFHLILPPHALAYTHGVYSRVAALVCYGATIAFMGGDVSERVILASTVQAGVRAAYAVMYVGLEDVRIQVPSLVVVGLGMCRLVVGAVDPDRTLLHVGVGAVAGCAFLGVVWRTEKAFIRELREEKKKQKIS